MTFRDTSTSTDAADVTIDIQAPETKIDITKINTLHELLALAIGDFEKVIANPRYSINLGTWHQPLDNGKCQVCLAGSVMAMHLGTSPTTECTPTMTIQQDGSTRTWVLNTDDAIWRRMHVLNSLRLGRIISACNIMRISLCNSDITGLHRKWSGKVRCSSARTRPQARLLLADLKLMQRDLAEAGL